MFLGTTLWIIWVLTDKLKANATNLVQLPSSVLYNGVPLTTVVSQLLNNYYAPPTPAATSFYLNASTKTPLH